MVIWLISYPFKYVIFLPLCPHLATEGIGIEKVVPRGITSSCSTYLKHFNPQNLPIAGCLTIYLPFFGFNISFPGHNVGDPFVGGHLIQYVPYSYPYLFCKQVKYPQKSFEKYYIGNRAAFLLMCKGSTSCQSQLCLTSG